MASGRGSTGNVIAALCSFFIPGLGLPKRPVITIIRFVLAGVLLVLSVWLDHSSLVYPGCSSVET